MRSSLLIIFVCASASIPLSASHGSAGELDAPTAHAGVWRLVVLDGKSSLSEPTKTRGESDDETMPPGEIPGSDAHIWTPAAWGLQLGTTKPKYVFRTYFGPSEGTPVAGDFNGDGFDELAVFVDGCWHLDFNGNGIWDAADLWVKSGAVGDRPIVGDWNSDGKSDIGVFTTAAEPAVSVSLLDLGSRSPKKTHIDLKGLASPIADKANIVICTDHGCVDRELTVHVHRFGTMTDTPVVGDWNGTGKSSIGTFNAGIWTLDLDGDGRVTDLDVVVRLGEPGDLPIVGDFNRDGTDELGIYRRGLWHLDTSGDRRLGSDDLTLRLGDVDDIPVVGDWDGDGRDQVGIIARGTPRSAESF